MLLDGYTMGWYKHNVDREYDGEVWSKIDDIKNIDKPAFPEYSS